MWAKLFLLCLWVVLGRVSGQVPVCTNVGDDGALRLVQTATLNSTNSGRLEICRGGRWGTIQSSSLFWPTKNVLVACLQLGFSSGLNSIPSIELSGNDQPLNGVPAHYMDILCTGTEQTLTECRASNVTDVTLLTSHVYIVCLPGTEAYSGLHTLPFGTAIEGDLRLVGSTANGRGAVEIYTRQLGWTSICPDEEWTDSDAQVVCQKLGYDSGTASNFTLAVTDVVPRRVSDAQCDSTLSGSGSFRISAGACTFSSSPCTRVANSYAGVTCTTPQEERSVRLVTQPSSEENRVIGIVEIVFDGRWGPICRPFDGTVVPQVICESLGYSREGSRLGTLNSELRTAESRLKPLWLSNVACTTESQSLSDCNLGSPIGYGPCQEILVVNCENPPFQLSSWGIALIVLSVLGVVGFVIWFMTHGKEVWKDRHSSDCYNAFTGALSSCAGYIVTCLTCGCDACERRSRPRPRPNPTVTTTTTTTPPARSSEPAAAAATVPAEPEPEPEEQIQDSELRKAPPPSYIAATNFPPPAQDLPPPYSGPPKPYLGGATPYPPPTAIPADYPPPNSNPTYPPPTSDPAYPPPVAYPPTSPSAPPTSDAAYPPTSPPLTDTPYPDTAYPPPTTYLPPTP